MGWNWGWWHDRCGDPLAFTAIQRFDPYAPSRLWCLRCDCYPPSSWITQTDDAIEAAYQLGGRAAVHALLYPQAGLTW